MYSKEEDRKKMKSRVGGENIEKIYAGHIVIY